jgi:hypothetical protein
MTREKYNNETPSGGVDDEAEYVDDGTRVSEALFFLGKRRFDQSGKIRPRKNIYFEIIGGSKQRLITVNLRPEKPAQAYEQRYQYRFRQQELQLEQHEEVRVEEQIVSEADDGVELVPEEQTDPLDDIFTVTEEGFNEFWLPALARIYDDMKPLPAANDESFIDSRQHAQIRLILLVNGHGEMKIKKIKIRAPDQKLDLSGEEFYSLAENLNSISRAARNFFIRPFHTAPLTFR